MPLMTIRLHHQIINNNLRASSIINIDFFLIIKHLVLIKQIEDFLELDDGASDGELPHSKLYNAGDFEQIEMNLLRIILEERRCTSLKRTGL